MTKITIETETITTDLTPSEAAAKIKEALGIAEWPQKGDKYHSVDDGGRDFNAIWIDGESDHYRLAHGNCSPTQEGLAWYKADEAKKAAIVAIRKHRDKTFGAFEPKDSEERYYGSFWKRDWYSDNRLATYGSITVPFRTKEDIERSFAECGEHWEELK